MKYLSVLFTGFILFTGDLPVINSAGKNWPEYNGDGTRSHYSQLTQVNKENVSQLKVAWEYASGGADTLRNRSQIQCNPLIIDGILYGVSADTQVFALDAATGKEKWRTNLTDNGGTTSRGVSYWAEGKDKRILFGAGRWLYALDADTGKPIQSFGQNGRIDLKTGLERPGADDYVRLNTPATIYKNLAIVGVRVSEGETALLGDVCAYDIRTGHIVWTFHTIPQRGEPGYETWFPPEPRQRLGGANAWAGMAIDRGRGIVYIPTGSAAYDFHGGNRKGDNLFANCLIALNAATGKRVWHFQFVHHDIWDRDLPAPPNLLTVSHEGKSIDAVAQTTKQGHIFVFDRVTGNPLFPIEEKSFSQDAVEGEFTSPTQPVPLKPAPFTRQTFTQKDVNSFVTDFDSVATRLSKARIGSPYIPLGEEMTIIFPGTDGGAQWGGSATDPEGVIYIPAKQLPSYSSLARREKTPVNSPITASLLYEQHCGSCHGRNRQGSHDGSYPSLIGIDNRLSRESIQKIIMAGKGMMPSFSHFPETQRQTIIDFLLNKIPPGKTNTTGKPDPFFQHMGYNRWYDRAGYPVSTPPWGTLTAVDLNTGAHIWQVPLGEYKELTARGIAPTGTDNYGGPLVTASGLVFIAASRDEQIRAFDKKTGKILWQHSFPAAGYASASTYTANRKQYIVIAFGGGKLNTKSGDKYVAFAL